MFPCSLTDSDVQLQRYHIGIAAAARARFAAQVRPAPRRRPMLAVVRRVGEVGGPALAFFGRLAHDSREGRNSKEQELAAYGVTWAADLAHQEELARELWAARHRRLAALPWVAPAHPA